MKHKTYHRIYRIVFISETDILNPFWHVRPRNLPVITLLERVTTLSLGIRARQDTQWKYLRFILVSIPTNE